MSSSVVSAPYSYVDGGCGGDGQIKQEYDAMEKWLDEHPEYVHDYFVRKARKGTVDCWLIAHELSSVDNISTSSASSSSKTSSGANTPVRKVSAQEFERGGTLNPIVSTVDGLQTFLGPSSSSSSTAQSAAKCRKRSRSELKALDEKELMYELVIDICNDLDVTSLCFKILQNLCILLNADRCSLFLVKGATEKYLASKLFDVTCDSLVETVCDREDEIRIPLGTGIAGYVAQTGETVNISDAYKDPRFNSEIDLRMGYKTRSILSLPIKDSEGVVIGVAQAVNKNSVRDEPFDEQDEKVFASYLAFCGIGLKNAQLYQKSLLENKRSQVLLDLARVIFEEQSDMSHLIHKIMIHTQSLLQCQRCQVLLVDTGSQGIFSQVFDMQASDFDNDNTYNREGPLEPRFPINIGITGYVAVTGETLNIHDAYTDARFDPKVDEGTDFRTQSILCMPIKSVQGHVVGVSQLVNKMDGSAFNKNNENLFEAFAIFCGMGISNTQMYETAVRAVARQRVALEVMSYHAIAPVEDAHRLQKLLIPSCAHYNLLDYHFCDFHLDDDNTLRATIRMFLDLDLVAIFHIDYQVLCRWMLSVKRNYRNVTYHNWRHAFNVTQTMFSMLKAGQMNNILSHMEQLALMVGCLCHDLDHRGTNNQFQHKMMSPLAELYSTSTMEHHHFDQCVMILSTKGSDILRNLSQVTYEQVLVLLENAILATDLALYFRYRGYFCQIVQGGLPDWSIDENRNLLRSMLMTASDVSAITKPWHIQRKVALLVASEFFEQGDLEKETLNLTPTIMMDREQIDKLPDLQVGFIDDICMPVYEAITKVSPRLTPLLDGCRQNRQSWLLEARFINKRSEETQVENVLKDTFEDAEKHQREDQEAAVGERDKKVRMKELANTGLLEEDCQLLVEMTRLPSPDPRFVHSKFIEASVNSDRSNVSQKDLGEEGVGRSDVHLGNHTEGDIMCSLREQIHFLKVKDMKPQASGSDRRKNQQVQGQHPPDLQGGQSWAQTGPVKISRRKKSFPRQGRFKHEVRSRHSNDEVRSRHSNDEVRSRDSNDEARPRHSNDEARTRHIIDEARSRDSNDEARPRHSNDEVRSRDSNNEARPRHSNDEARSRHSNDEARSRHSNDEARSRHSNDEARSRHSNDEARSRHSNDEARSRHSNDEARSRHSNDEVRSRHSNDEARSRHSNDEARSQHSNDETRSRHSNDETRSRHSNDGARSRHRNDGARSRHDDDNGRSIHDDDRSTLS